MADLRVKLSNWDNQVFTLDPDSVTSREYKTIKAHTGLSLNKFWLAVASLGEDVDVAIIDVLRWLFLKRGGILIDVFTDDEYSPAEFLMSMIEMNSDEEEAEDDDPKAPEAVGPTLS